MYNRKKIYVSVFLVCLVLQASAWAQLKLPDLFSDHMVMQRHLPIPVWGVAPARSEVVVHFGEIEIITQSDADGRWKVMLPARSAGGPHQLRIKALEETILFEDVLVGEVWLCSGQSNMEFPLEKSASGEMEIPHAQNSQIRLFRMGKIHDLYKSPFTKEQKLATDKGAFFHKTSWQKCTPQTAVGFSAVGYFFGKKLHDTLQIPIGLIQNAVGGSPVQSWIRKEALARHPQLNEFVKFPENETWLDLENIHPWLKQRAGENLATWLENESDNPIPGHPFAPAYLFESAIRSLVPYAIAGVIWYQGESNATHPESYPALFETMVEDWRQVWGQDLPFYFVQLPRIGNRNRWPEFRAAQETCLAIRNTGMVVAIDQGHPIDVHPKEKKVIGQRLANLALAKTYGEPILAESPTLLSFDWQEKERRVALLFKNTHGQLQTNNAGVIKGFTLQGYTQEGTLEVILQLEKVENDGDKITIFLPDDFLPTTVKYAWAPFPENNLVNKAGLPLAPFKLEFNGNN